MALRDKSIQFFLDVDIPSGSEDSFCDSDDDVDGETCELDELLKNFEDTEEKAYSEQDILNTLNS